MRSADNSIPNLKLQLSRSTSQDGSLENMSEDPPHPSSIFELMAYLLSERIGPPTFPGMTNGKHKSLASYIHLHYHQTIGNSQTLPMHMPTWFTDYVGNFRRSVLFIKIWDIRFRWAMYGNFHLSLPGFRCDDMKFSCNTDNLYTSLYWVCLRLIFICI